MNKIIGTLFVIITFAAVTQPVYAFDASVSDPSANANRTIAYTAEDNRAAILHAYLSKKSSPFADNAGQFVKEADRLNLDWKLVAAISGVESTFGQHIPAGSYNAWGWGIFTGASDGIHFTDWNDGISKVSEGLHDNYIGKGARTVDEIGRIYAASPAWSWKVKYFINDIETFYAASTNTLAVTI